MKEVPKHLNGIYYSPIIESQLSEIYFVPRHLIRYILCKYNCDNDQLLRIEDDINSIEGKLATLVKQNVYLMRAKQNRDAILVDYVYAKAVNGRNEYLAICESIKETSYEKSRLN